MQRLTYLVGPWHLLVIGHRAAWLHVEGRREWVVTVGIA